MSDEENPDSGGNSVPQLVAGSLPAFGRPGRCPAIVSGAGRAAEFAWEEFFRGEIRNLHTRKAYEHAVRRFLQWLTLRGVELHEATPGLIGEYFDQHPSSPATRKLHLAAIRRFFDRLVVRHVVVLNPALSVRGPRHQVVEGRTPEMPVAQARTLLRSIDTRKLIGLRDRAILAVLIYTAARVGAVAGLRRRDFWHDGTQYQLRFHEKGGKLREIPVRADLEQIILTYLTVAGLTDAVPGTPLFQPAIGQTDRLSPRPLAAADICRMVKRRLARAGLSAHFSPHSFRVTTITDLLLHGAALEDVQHLAGHADPRTTRLYDRRQRRVRRNLVERITI
ncbi:MAG: tyrosine-type recombinase/integrase [Pirellulales bacterium]|nr:tyrosine-type recombinase/integrase [Pirellulales bacterium]